MSGKVIEIKQGDNMPKVSPYLDEETNQAVEDFCKERSTENTKMTKLAFVETAIREKLIRAGYLK